MKLFQKLFKSKNKLSQNQLDKKVKETKVKYSKQDKILAELPKHIEKKIQKGKIKKHHGKLLKQREQIYDTIQNTEHLEKNPVKDYVTTGIAGFDKLLEQGIPKGSSILLCAGPGSGKTIMGLQILNNKVIEGKKCIYMTFEENVQQLRQHMRDFGWDPKKYEDKGNLILKKYDPFSIKRSVDALLEKAKGDLLINVFPVLFPKGFKPDFVVIDSITAIASAFYDKEDTYRICIEQLFKLLQQTGATSFLITESSDIPKKLTNSGVEEFLADGVIILYNIKKGNIRESAIEVLKLRGAAFQKKIVPMKIESGKGMIVYPEQEVFADV